MAEIEKKKKKNIVASEKAIELKRNLMHMPTEDYEYLTFGELAIGNLFIYFPSPGDNSGHGGFKKIHYMFTKIAVKDKKSPEKKDHGKATKWNNDTDHEFPNSMPVILIG
ncbi:MAG: hypothetical protein WC010_00205 [Candidatus Absconditabacterales bacterium]